jgi:preprotein translocase subunit SecG
MNILMIFKITQMVIAVFLMFLILIQSKGAGLAYGVKSSFSMYRSLRGVEKMVFILTIFFGTVLVLNSVVILLLS